MTRLKRFVAIIATITIVMTCNPAAYIFASSDISPQDNQTESSENIDPTAGEEKDEQPSSDTEKQKKIEKTEKKESTEKEATEENKSDASEDISKDSNDTFTFEDDDVIITAKISDPFPGEISFGCAKITKKSKET